MSCFTFPWPLSWYTIYPGSTWEPRSIVNFFFFISVLLWNEVKSMSTLSAGECTSHYTLVGHFDSIAVINSKFFFCFFFFAFKNYCLNHIAIYIWNLYYFFFIFKKRIYLLPINPRTIHKSWKLANRIIHICMQWTLLIFSISGKMVSGRSNRMCPAWFPWCHILYSYIIILTDIS